MRGVQGDTLAQAARPEPAVPAAITKTPREFPIILSAQLLTSLGFGFSTPFLPLFIAEMGDYTPREAAFWSGMAATCAGVVMTFAGPFWGIVSDWFGYKKNALRAAYCAAVIVAATGITQNILQLALVRALMGGFTGVVPANMGLLAAVMPRHRLGFAVGLAQGMSSLGFTLGPSLGGLAVIWLGYRWGFLASGALIAVAGTLVLLGVRSPAQAKTTTPKNARQFVTDIKSLLAIPGIKGALLLVAMSQLGPNIAFPVLVFFVKSLGTDVSPGTIGIYFTISGLSATAASWAMGALSTHFKLKTLLILGCAIAASGATGTSTAQSVLAANIWGAVTGVGVGMLVAGGAAYAGTIAPPSRTGAAFGVVQSANAIGFGFGPFIGGVLANAYGLRVPFMAQAALMALLAVVVLRLRRPAASEPAALP